MPTSKKILEIDGLTIEVVRKPIKNCYMRLNEETGNIAVSMPWRAKDKDVEAFVRSRRAWVDARLMQEKRTFSIDSLVVADGAATYVWGEPAHIACEPEAKESRIEMRGLQRVLVLRVAKDASDEAKKKVLFNFYHEEVKREMARSLDWWEKATGNHACEWRVKNMKTRWGTCNTREKRIWLSSRLAMFSPELLDYVCLHEVAHLQQANHGPKFIRILDEKMPNWKDLRAALRNGLPAL